MGRKCNPTSFRTGITKDWTSRWFATGKDYARFVLEDLKIRTFLRKKLQSAGLERIEVERSIASLKLILYVSRPGVVIGRGGTGIEDLKVALKELTKAKIDIVVEEVRVMELSARLVADNIARQIERRISYKRAMYVAADRAMDKGAKGVKILCAGVLGGASSISRKNSVTKGSIPNQTLRADIDYAGSVALTGYGTIGIKVWIYKGIKPS